MDGEAGLLDGLAASVHALQVRAHACELVMSARMRACDEHARACTLVTTARALYLPVNECACARLHLQVQLGAARQGAGTCARMRACDERARV